MTTLNCKCHKQKAYPHLYKAEQFLACMECYIPYVTWCGHGLPDVSVLTLVLMCTYQAILPMLHI